jgi:hypothetical protein
LGEIKQTASPLMEVRKVLIARRLREVACIFPFVMMISLNGCSNLEPELKKLASNSSLTIVVKDSSGTYWAFGAARITNVSGNKVTLKEGTVVAKGTGTASSGQIADTLIDLRSKANAGGFGATETNVSGTSGSISAKIDVLAQETSVSVAEIVSSKPQN